MFGLGFQGLLHQNPPWATAPACGKLCLVTMTSKWKRNGDQMADSKESLLLEKSRSHKHHISPAHTPLGSTSLLFLEFKLRKKGDHFAICYKSAALEKVCVSFNPPSIQTHIPSGYYGNTFSGVRTSQPFHGEERFSDRCASPSNSSLVRHYITDRKASSVLNFDAVLWKYTPWEPPPFSRNIND